MNAGETDPHYPRTRWIAMAILLIAGFMNLMDITIVNVALPTMRQSLGASSSEIEWVVAAYTLAFALGLLPFGRLGDTFGRRRMFLAGVAAFSVCSLLAGIAPDMPTLIGARTIQGFSAAMMAPQTLAIAQVIFPPHERASAFALFGMSASIAAVSGQIIGGLLIGADIAGLDWRPIFLVNVPIGLAAIAVGLRFIPPMPGHRGIGVDSGGIVLAGFAMFLLAFPLIEGRGYGWPAWSFAMLAAAIPVFYLFVAWQLRQAGRRAPQVLPVTVLGEPGFLRAALTSTAFFSGIPGLFLVMAIFLQSGFGLTPLQSGLTNAPFPLGILIGSIVAGRLGIAHVRRRVLVGALAMAAGMAWLQFVVSGVGDAVVRLEFLPPLFVAGFGMGTAISPLFQSALAGIDGRDAGSASGSLQSLQQAGGALGVAIAGQIFFPALEGGIAGAAQSVHAAYRAAFGLVLFYQIAVFLLVAVGSAGLRQPAMPRPVAKPPGGA